MVHKVLVGLKKKCLLRQAVKSSVVDVKWESTATNSHHLLLFESTECLLQLCSADGWLVDEFLLIF